MSTERRRFPRYDCIGPAQLFLPQLSTPLEAKVTNLSLGGCRFHLLPSSNTHWLKLDDPVELAFAILSEPFRVRAEPCFRLHGDTVGLHFVQVSPRSLRRMGDLVLALQEQANGESELLLRAS
jgi:hypothetical protein